MTLEGRRILLGVSGSIAAYKAADLCSQLSKLDADLHVVLTHAASQFVCAPTFRALTRNPVVTDLFDEPDDRRIAHIDLAQSADLVVVAPATANIIAKYAAGIADDMLTTCLLATPRQTPVVIAPAMNTVMWNHPATVANLKTLESRGVIIVPPGYGLLACQDVGDGKLADVASIVQQIVEILTATSVAVKSDFAGKHILITAGATREPLDPVRFLTNRSSGKMGLALAEEAAARGGAVTLVTGHISEGLRVPKAITQIVVERAEEMSTVCVELFPTMDIFIGAAAVADYAPASYTDQKIKKSAEDELFLRLRKTPDVLAALGQNRRADQLVIGFAAETSDLVSNALAKIVSKNLDLIAANDVTQEGAGFDADTNIVTLIWPGGNTLELPILSKRDTAAKILDEIALLFQN